MIINNWHKPGILLLSRSNQLETSLNRQVYMWSSKFCFRLITLQSTPFYFLETIPHALLTPRRFRETSHKSKVFEVERQSENNLVRFSPHCISILFLIMYAEYMVNFTGCNFLWLLGEFQSGLKQKPSRVRYFVSLKTPSVCIPNRAENWMGLHKFLQPVCQGNRAGNFNPAETLIM